MDRNQEIDEIRVADLEFQVLDLESKLQHYRDTVDRLQTDISRRDAQISRAAALMSAAGLHIGDNGAQTDAEKVAKVQERQIQGYHMEILQTAIQDNPMVADAWKRFMSALRLCGYDGSNDANNAP